jgi:hypothetical protein
LKFKIVGETTNRRVALAPSMIGTPAWRKGLRIRDQRAADDGAEGRNRFRFAPRPARSAGEASTAFNSLAADRWLKLIVTIDVAVIDQA